MTLHRLYTVQRLPVTRDAAWDFFSDPKQLPVITPDWLDFQMTTPLPEVMTPGTILGYTIRPIAGIPVQWVTEITHVDAPHVFVDEQRFGPYRFWHHAHRFRPVTGGVEVEDLVYYALPLGPLGALAHRLTVKRRLSQIFAYRRKTLEERFGRYSPSTTRAPSA